MSEPRPVGFGVVGARSFVANAAVLPAIDAAHNARLVATSARGGPVPERWAATSVESYDAVIAHPDVDAVYLPLPNGLHRFWAERAAAAGKHVLCEKPLAPDAATAAAMADTCHTAGVVLAEAWMTPFGARYRHAIDLARNGEIGRIEAIDATFTFTIGPDAADNYRWDATQGGGALLDVGIYCLGPIVELFPNPHSAQVVASGSLAASGVDERVHAELRFASGTVGRINCSFVDDECQRLTISGTTGRIVVGNNAFTGGVDDTEIVIERSPATAVERVSAPSNDPYRAMIESFADAVAGRAEWPRPIERSIDMAQLIERIRQRLAEGSDVEHHTP